MLDAGRTACTVNLTFQRGHDWSFRSARRTTRCRCRVDVHDGARPTKQKKVPLSSRGNRRRQAHRRECGHDPCCFARGDDPTGELLVPVQRRPHDGTVCSRSAVALSPSNWGADRHRRNLPGEATRTPSAKRRRRSPCAGPASFTSGGGAVDSVNGRTGVAVPPMSAPLGATAGAGGVVGELPEPGPSTTRPQQDLVGAMVNGNTETGAALTYDDTNVQSSTSPSPTGTSAGTSAQGTTRGSPTPARPLRTPRRTPPTAPTR